MVSSKYILSFPSELAPFWFSFCCSGLISAMKSNLSSSLCLHPIRGTGEGAAFPKAAVMRTTDQRARPVPSLEFLIFTSTPRAAALFFKGTLWCAYNHLNNLYLIQFYTDKSLEMLRIDISKQAAKEKNKSLCYQPKKMF